MTSDETRMSEAMECLRAEDGLAERVLERAANPGRRARRGGPLPLALVVAVCATALLATGGVAYAVATSGFFQRAFGDHGLGERSEWGFTTSSGEAYEFTREFSDAASEGVVEDLEAAVEEVGLETTGNGFTLTIEDMVVDENGCGAATFTLENPDGLGLDAKNGVGMWDQTGMLWLTGSEGLDLLSMGFADGEPDFPNVYCVYERGSLTETSVRATMYFDSFTGLDSVLTGARWELKWHVGEGGDASKRHEAATDWFTPTKVVGTRGFSCDGMSASLSRAVRRAGGPVLHVLRVARLDSHDGRHRACRSRRGGWRRQHVHGHGPRPVHDFPHAYPARGRDAGGEHCDDGRA